MFRSSRLFALGGFAAPFSGMWLFIVRRLFCFGRIDEWVNSPLESLEIGSQQKQDLDNTFSLGVSSLIFP